VPGDRDHPWGETVENDSFRVPGRAVSAVIEGVLAVIGGLAVTGLAGAAAWVLLRKAGWGGPQ